MKIKILCHNCVVEGATSEKEKYTILEVNDNGFYSSKCYKGHAIDCFIGNRKHELLFDEGLFSLSDSNFRNSIFNIAASLERFYEYFITIMLLHNGIDVKNISSTWKQIDNQSERQLGGFIILFLNEFGYKPELIKDSVLGFRNKVIHKGYFPTKKETEEYINEIGKYLIQYQKVIISKYNMEITKEYFNRNIKIKEISKTTSQMNSFMLIPTYFQMSIKNPRAEFNLSEALEYVKKYKKNVYEPEI